MHIHGMQNPVGRINVSVLLSYLHYHIPFRPQRIQTTDEETQDEMKRFLLKLLNVHRAMLKEMTMMIGPFDII